MYAQSRRLFIIFLWLTLTSITGILFYGIISLFLSNFGNTALWINITLFFVSYFLVIIYFSDRAGSVIKIILGFLLLLGAFFAAQYFIRFFLGSFKIIQFSNLQLLLLITGLFLILRLYLNSIKKGFDKIYMILNNESRFPSKDRFREWAEGQIDVKNEKIEPVWFIKLITNTGFFLLALSFIGIAKNPETKWFHSLFLLCLGLGSVGIYLILYQLSSILKWKLLGYGIKEEIVKNWNRMIGFIYLPLALLPLLIPWNFILFPTKWLTDALNKFFSRLALTINLAPAAQAMENQPLNEAPAGNENLSTLIWNTTWTIVKYLVLALCAYIAFYLILALIGSVLLIIFLKRERPAWAMFFIRRFQRIIKIITGFFKILYMILMLILKIFGFGNAGKKKVDKRTQRLEKQLLSFFDKYDQLPDEKMEEIKTIIKEFVRMIEIAGRLVTPYYFHYGPKEYTHMLIGFLPDLKNDLIRIVDIFNESRYSLHLLNEEKKKDFKVSIDVVIQEISSRPQTPAK